MKINIAVCDDDRNFLDVIQKELYKIAEKMNIDIEIYSYTDGNNVVHLISDNKEDFDILFLDIDMPNTSGMEVAKKIRDNEAEIMLVFVSAHEQYVFESIEYSPFRYIRKSRIDRELFLAMKAAYACLEKTRENYIFVKTEESEVRIKYSDIMYFETVSRKIGIFLSNGEVLVVRKTIKELFKELSNESFVRIHSGCVANLKYIERFSTSNITLDNGKILPVSRGRGKNIKIALMNYWGDKV